MIRRTLLALTLTFASVAAAAPAQRLSFVDPSDAPASGSAYGHLQYFGFYASAMGPWNYTAELAPFTNLTWIHLGSVSNPAAAIPEFVTRLDEARVAGVQAVLSIEALLFLNERGDPRPDVETEDLLIELRARIEEKGLLDTVAMIYPKDEPFRNFVDARDPSFVDRYVTGDVYDEVHRDLVQVNAVVERVFPDTPIGVILSGYDLHHRFFSIPENFDWVGFDCYRSLFRGCEDGRNFVDHYRRLLQNMQPDQRLIAVPEAWADDEELQRAEWPDILLSRLRHHYEMVLSEPRFIAFVPFIWSIDGSGDPSSLALNRFPEVYDDGVGDRGTAFVEAVLDIGSAIKHGQPVYPNMAWAETEAVGARPKPNFDADITAVAADGTVDAWAVDRALTHKNLRVQFRLYDDRGRLLHKSELQRTDRRDAADPELPPLGLHGIRHRLPEPLLQRHGRRGLLLDMVVFADGPEGEIVRIESRRFTPGRPKPQR
jgi:hypothetical protein